MKVKRNTGYRSKNQKQIKLVLDIKTLDILCRYVLSSSVYIKMNNLSNLRQLMNILDPSTYNNDPEKNKRVEFINKALEAKIDYHLVDKDMIWTHISTGLDFDIDFIDLDNIELNKNELEWVDKLITESLQYQFIYNKIDDIQDICTRFNASDYMHRGDIVHEFEDMIDSLKNDFRKSKIESNTTDISFSLREGEFVNSVTDTYNAETNPNRKLMCGMTGLNEMLNGGFEAGRVYMLLGISGVGKSLTLLNLMVQFKKYNRNYKTKDPTKIPCIVLLTMENTVLETVTRLFSMTDDTGSGSMNDYTVEQVLDILRTKGELVLTEDNPIDIVIRYKANKSIDTSYLYTMYDDLEDEGYEVICFIQDHVKRIRSIYGATDLRIELGDIVNEMKVFAAEKDIPVITISHLNRDASRVVEEGEAKGATADLTRKLGKSNVGESLLMVENLDYGIILNLEFDRSGNRYMCFNLIKYRGKVKRTYIAQPFEYNSTIKLVDDLYDVPAFKETLVETRPQMQTSTFVRHGLENTVKDIGQLVGDVDDENAFDTNSMVDVTLNEDVKDEDEEVQIVQPIYSTTKDIDMGTIESFQKQQQVLFDQQVVQKPVVNPLIFYDSVEEAMKNV